MYIFGDNMIKEYFSYFFVLIYYLGDIIVLSITYIIIKFEQNEKNDI